MAMPSFADSAVIFILALMLFGPKKLPQLARQLGKLMAEFRRASNEFRMQMEDELRIEDQKEHQKKVDEMAGPPSTLPDPEHPHLPLTAGDGDGTVTDADPDHGSVHDGTQPIAESGGLRMMPPSTGLPVESATYGTSAREEASLEAVPAHTNGNAHHEFSEDSSVSEHNIIPEHNIVPEHNIIPEHSSIPEYDIQPPEPHVGMSSEEPAETRSAEEQTHA